MKYFLIKGFKGKTDDIFRMGPSDDFVLFAAFGLKNLESTIKGILPRGYGVRKKQTLSRRLKESGSFEMRSLFGVPMLEVKEVCFRPPVEKELDYFNSSRGQTFNIKIADVKYWDHIERLQNLIELRGIERWPVI